MNFSEQISFGKELKKLRKKYPSLLEDLLEFKRVVAVVPFGNSKHFNVITRTEICAIIKARLFCRCLKGSSLRVIYAYHENCAKIDFIEIYYKGNKENEDRERIKQYLKDL
jgi:hypothetical protein